MIQTMILADGTEIEPVHFAIATGGRHRIACTPGLVELHATGGHPPPFRRTDDPRAANCPCCRDTEEYRAAMLPYLDWMKMQGRT